jgi:RNA polymerase sigma-70 factor (ECF subfamily)
MQATTTSSPIPSFADWYRANHPGLVEAVLRAVRPAALATDAVDEAFARAFAGWDRVQTMRSPTGWVYRVAVNEARRQLRRATREQAVLAAAPGPGSTPPPGGEAWLLVHDLPVRQRATVVLRHVAGLTEAEVGAALGVTRSTVSSSLAAAYRTLAKKLAEDEQRSTTMPDIENPRGPLHPTDRAPDEDWPLRLMVARRCGPDGCDADDLLGTAGRTAVAYGDAVRATVKVRPGDLVAVADGPAGPEIVWRWWGGTVEAVDGGSGTVSVSRNVTQTVPTDSRRVAVDVAVPGDLRGGIDVGELVWFGEEDGRKVVVAVAGPEAAGRAQARFPHIRAAYRIDGPDPG